MKYAKTVLVMAMILFTVSLASCSPGDILKGITGGNVDVDKDGNINIIGEEGEVQIGKAKWEASKMHGLSAPKAKLDTYVSTEEGSVYSFSDMKESDAEAYVEKIKQAGFTFDSVTLGDYSFTGTNADGLIISFIYDKESGAGSVISGIGDPPSGESDGEGAVIGGTDTTWDSEKVGGLPDPGVAIISYTSVGGDINYALEVLDSPADYVEEIKACGFTVDVYVAETNDLYLFTAQNSDGDRISFSASDTGATISFEKNKN